MSQQGAQILDQTRDHLTTFVHFPSNAAATVATLWAAFTHLRDKQTEQLACKTSPRLYFGSDLPASGKSAALEMVCMISDRGQIVLDPTPATHAIMTAQQHASVFVDEVDELFGAGGAKSTLRSLFNGGYKEGPTWSRANGDALSVFGPLAMAGLSSRFRTSAALSALRSRTYMIEMVQRPESSETVDYDSEIHGPTTDYVRNCLHAWVRKNTPEIMSHVAPEFPGVRNRKLELAKPLLKIADTAQGHWPQTARAAISEILLGIEDPDDDTATPDDELPLAERLFKDMQTVWPANTPRLPSTDLTALLRDLPNSLWRTLWPSPTAAPRQLKTLLAPYGIEPTVMRLSADEIARGYIYADVSALFPQQPEADESEIA